MQKRKDEHDLMLYRLDALERRLESVERALINRSADGSQGNINTELLNIVLGMVRQQVPIAPAQTADATAQSPRSKHESSVGSTTPEKPESTCGRSFIFDRRKTVV